MKMNNSINNIYNILVCIESNKDVDRTFLSFTCSLSFTHVTRIVRDLSQRNLIHISQRNGIKYYSITDKGKETIDVLHQYFQLVGGI